MNILKSGGTLFLAYEVRMGRAIMTALINDQYFYQKPYLLIFYQA